MRKTLPKTSTLRSVVVAVSLGILAACSGGEDPLPLESFSAEELNNRAEFELEAGAADDAARLFGEVERLYPYSEWAKRALVMQAFSYHRDRDYPNSRSSAQRFIDFYPDDDDAAYAQYLISLSYYDQIDEVGRDQKLTFEALQALRGVIENYPESEYARSAKLKFELAFDHLASKEMEVGRCYQRRGQHLAAIGRFKTVVDRYDTTSHTPEALHRMTESFLSLGIRAEAQKSAAILGYNYPGSKWYRYSYDLIQDKG